MAKQLTVSVTLQDPKSLALVSFLPGDTPPKWVRDLITNPAAFAAPDAPVRGSRRQRSAPTEVAVDNGSPQGDPAPQDTGGTGDGGVPDPNPDPGEDGDGAVVPEPPRAGKGSGADAWRAYADLLGVEVQQDDTRDQVIAAVDAHTGAGS